MYTGSSNRCCLYLEKEGRDPKSTIPTAKHRGGNIISINASGNGNLVNVEGSTKNSQRNYHSGNFHFRLQPYTLKYYSVSQHMKEIKNVHRHSELSVFD